MNRIIIIGNGFDLAHGLKTSYRNFIDKFWEETAIKIKNNGGKIYEDDFISVPRGLGTWFSRKDNNDYEDLLLNLEQTGISIIYNNRFLDMITQEIFLLIYLFLIFVQFIFTAN